MKFTFEKLDIYRKTSDLVDNIYLLTRDFPKEELFGLTQQLRRAAVSILLNIAEGSSRASKEFKRFLDIARGSVFECAAILEVSFNQQYICESKFNDFKDTLVEISKMLSGLKRSLK